MQDVLAKLLASEGIKPHSISSRAKTVQSLAGKVYRTDNRYKYDHLADITDLVGVRIITHFTKEVGIIGDFIDREFDVDVKNSVDKRLSLNPNTFGYISLHKICGLNDARRRLPEYARFADLKCEIQIRTILQHAWAEIEHDIGYKSFSEIPTQMRRRFARVAALLETADEEFARLSTALEDYEREAKAEVLTGKFSKPLDSITLQQFVSNSLLYRSIEHEINQSPDGSGASHRLHNLVACGITDLKTLNKRLEQYKDKIIALAKLQGRITPHHPTLYLLVQCVCASENASDEHVCKRLRYAMYPIDDFLPETTTKSAEHLLERLRQIRSVLQNSQPPT